MESDKIVGEMSTNVLLMCTYCCIEEQNGEEPQYPAKTGNCSDMRDLGGVADADSVSMLSKYH